MLEPRRDGVEVLERARGDALGAGGAGERGEVGVSEADELERQPLRAEVVDLGAVEEWLGRRDGPLVLDAKITPDFCAEWLEEAFK